MNHIQSSFCPTAYLLPRDFAGLSMDSSIKNIRRGWMIHAPGGNVFQNE